MPGGSILVTQSDDARNMRLRLALSAVGISLPTVFLPDAKRTIEHLHQVASARSLEYLFPILLFVSLDDYPTMEGSQLIRRIRSDPLWQTLAVIGLTTSHYGTSIEQGYGLGMNTFLVQGDLDSMVPSLKIIAKFWLSRDPTIQERVESVKEELITRFARNPEEMRLLDPRKFEEVVADILKDQGHTVELTPPTRDGGRDIVVGIKTSIGNLLAIVECKRWSPPHKIGIDIVERFLFAIRDKYDANLGLIATTTYFTSGAQKTARSYEYILKLADFDKLHKMVKRYGTWRMTNDSEIWIPALGDIGQLTLKENGFKSG
jgi:HJR/Mrr/RecB family endonuclease/CheY-like chemotaxis protein